MVRRLIIAVIALALLGGGAFLYIQKKGGFGGPSERELQAQLAGGTFEPAGPGKELYKSSQFKFSVEVPEGYTITSLEEGDGRSLLVRPPQEGELPEGTGANSKDFQITISPFDEEGPLTPQRIVQDIPDMRITDPQQVVIASGAVTALIFKTDSDVYGESREAWFVAGGNLYQVSAPVDADPVIGPMLESMKFEQ